MKPRKYNQIINFKLSDKQRKAAEDLAKREGASLSEAGRVIFQAGLEAMGLKC